MTSVTLMTVITFILGANNFDNNNFRSYKTLWSKRRYQDCRYDCYYRNSDLYNCLLSVGKRIIGSNYWRNCLADYSKMAIQYRMAQVVINRDNHMDYRFDCWRFITDSFGTIIKLFLMINVDDHFMLDNT